MTFEKIDNNIHKNHRIYSDSSPSLPVAPQPSSLSSTTSAVLSSSRFIPDEKDSIIVSLQEKIKKGHTPYSSYLPRHYRSASTPYG